MSQFLASSLTSGFQFLENHISTIVVSTGVFLLMSLCNALLTRDSDAKQKPSVVIKGPTPKWEWLNIMNYVVIGTFVSSFAFVAMNYSNNFHSNGTFVPLVVIWCLCLAYFFGFFGISMIDKDSLASSPSTYGYAQVQAEVESIEKSHNAAKKTTEVAKVANNTPFVNLKVKPTHDGPICSDKKCDSTISKETLEDIDYSQLNDEEVLEHLNNGQLKDHQLEKKLGNTTRAVAVRRMMYESALNKKLDLIPHTGYDYDKVFGANCEIVIGYVPLPCGIVGPLLVNGEEVYVPMATTEGCLVASTNRGCKAITASGGANSILLKDAITRAPCLRMPSAMRAAAVKKWVEVPANYEKVRDAFNSTTNYGTLESVSATVAGRNVYLRFCCMSGDAMGMNMVSKGCLKAIELLEQEFPDMVLVAISGNMCTDKKPSAINWILGRGKSVVVEAVIPEHIVKSVLKTTVHDIIETNKQKNHIGSAMAGSIGGFNAHAANIVTAVFLATGQDPAQNVESSNCLTIMEYADDGESLHVSCTMPSIEVGTVGGGTHLPAQAGCLEICGVRGASKTSPGENSRKLAQIVAASVLAGELSLMAALAANHLVRSHMQHNRKPTTESASAPHPPASLKKAASMMDIKSSH